MFNKIDARTWAIWRVAIVFAAVYFAEGLGQNSGLIKQPLTLYFNNQLHWSSTIIAVVGFVTMLPWYIKPIWGLASDCMPLFGSRRRVYLVGAAGIAALGYLGMYFSTVWPLVLLMLFLTGFGLAVVSTTSGALLVENGKKTGLSSSFVSLQWLFFFLAVLGASKVSGWICETYKDTPIVTINISAALACAVISFLLLICWKFIDEEKTSERASWAAARAKILPAIQALKSVLVPVRAAAACLLMAYMVIVGRLVGATKLQQVADRIRLRDKWSELRSMRPGPVVVAGGFIFMYYFSPSVGNPLYLYMTQDLHISQATLGNLGAIEAAGYIVGGFIFLGISRLMTLKQLIVLSIILGTASNLSLLFLTNEFSADLINFFGGICGMLATIAGLSLAAEFCPEGAEGVTYALLMAVHNLAGPASSFSGALLYDHFWHSITPLIWVSAGFTALALFLVRFLDWNPKKASG